MSKKKVLVLGFFSLIVVGLILAPLAAAVVSAGWPSVSVSPASNPIVVTGGTGVSIGTVGYVVNPITGYTTTQIPPTNLQPGQTLLITVPFTNSAAAPENIGLGITGLTDTLLATAPKDYVPGTNDLASQTTAVVWISPNIGEISPVTGTGSNDYVLTTASGLVAGSSLTGAPTPIPLNDYYKTTGAVTGSIGTINSFTGSGVAYYKLQLPTSGSTLDAAESQSLSIATTITGS